jgi:SAM-dependent methyltransferase
MNESIFTKIIRVFKTRGTVGLIHSIMSKILHFKARYYFKYNKLIQDCNGLEIGGPSQIFSKNGLFPVYPIISNLDNCNFSNNTVWEGKIFEGKTFHYSKNKNLGNQYIAEATNLHMIPDNYYDLVLSSHAIEHTANPLLALKECFRVLKITGILVLVVPHKDGTFDNKRPVTSIEHLVRDFQENMGEDDLTHLSEILQLHDFSFSQDPSSNYDSLKLLAQKNLDNRCLHHHVFDTKSVLSMLKISGFKILDFELCRPHHIITISSKAGIKSLDIEPLSNSQLEVLLKKSPFPSDRHVIT